MKTLMAYKKGQIATLQSVIITLVTIGIVLGIGFLVLQEFRDAVSDDNTSEAWQGVNDTIEAINEIPTWLSIIVILAIVGILLVIVFNVLPRGQTSV